MWVDLEAEVRSRRHDRIAEADAWRAAADAPAGRARFGRTLAGYGSRLRQAAGFGLVRTGLRLLDTGRA